MTPQRSFIHYLVVPFLIGMLVAAGYFVFTQNPEIMNQESFYQKLSNSSTQSEVRIVTPNINPEVFQEITTVKMPKQSHRFIEASEEKFKPIPLKSKEVSWKIIKGTIVSKDKTHLSSAAANGDIKWTFDAPEGHNFIAGPITHYGRAWFISTDLGRIYAFDIETGDLLWYLEKDHKYLRESIISAGQLLTFYEDKPGQSWALEVLDPKNGQFIKVIKKLELPIAGDPFARDNVIYFATQSGQLRAVDINTGNTLWTSEGTSGFKSGPELIGEKIYITNEDGLLLGFERKNGRKSSEIELGSVVHEPFQLVEGTFLALSVDVNGYLIAADLKANKRLWRYHLNMPGVRHSMKLVRLSQQSLNQLNFASPVAGWTAWTNCSASRICIFDVKEGKLLHRVELKATPLGEFDITDGDAAAIMYVPVADKDSSRITALEVMAKTTPSAVIK